MKYAQLHNGEILAVIESATDPDGVNGEWVACGNAGPGWTTSDGGLTFLPPVPAVNPEDYRATKRAFQNRFPKLANGVSTKWDAMCLFLSSDSYAASLNVSGEALFGLRMLVTTGIERLSASPFVDFAPTGEAAGLSLLLTQASIPAAFRLSIEERNALLLLPLSPAEKYTA